MPKITKQDAITAAKAIGITFEKGEQAGHLDSHQMFELGNLARATGYRKPKQANASTGTYFYDHLKKLLR
jgi:hypothetical protein